MRYKYLFFAFTLLSGCVTASIEKSTVISGPELMNVEEFSRRFGYRYSFDTLDDVIILTNRDKEIRVILNSLVGYINGSTFYLKDAPFYHRGKIMVPREIAQIIAVKEYAVFRPTFTIKTILVDAGHGGRDPGAVSPSGIKEKDVNLKIAKYLKQELRKKGFKVFLSRSTDEFLELEERVQLAEKVKADLFISIHANANNSRHVRGVEIYYLSPEKLNSSKRAAKLANSIKLRKTALDFSAKTIVWDLRLTKNYSLSVELAHTFYSVFNNLGFKIKPPRKAPFYVLKWAYVPSVLVETGYLTNVYDEKILRKPYYQKQVARAIAQALAVMRSRYSQ